MTRSPKIKLMTLFLGANDAVLPTVNPRQHVSLPDYKKYLHEMLEIIRLESPGTKVVIITPPPVDPSVWGAKCMGKGNQPDRTVEHTRLYRDACVQVGVEAKSKWGSDLVLVDIWTVFFGTESGVNENGFTYSMDQVSDLLSDGLHLAAKGNQLLGAAVLKAIKESWPELSPEILVPRVIFHDQVDANDLPGCLFRNA
ncbi:SGNH hydrolase-type esterase domain-containing protein [Obelidium mucronatum]|nr:SGNH hydrolase-type esterase domain-containing protein [Obelidium mucronatum]